MCEIMTIAAAVIFSVIYIVQRKKNIKSKSTFATMLMFWGAALMWLIDCIFSAAEGEPFFDLSKEDAVLGAIILGAGIAIYAVMLVLEKRKSSANA